jgi:RND family efflux transporter MFP subunit
MNSIISEKVGMRACAVTLVNIYHSVFRTKSVLDFNDPFPNPLRAIRIGRHLPIGSHPVIETSSYLATGEIMNASTAKILWNVRLLALGFVCQSLVLSGCANSEPKGAEALPEAEAVVQGEILQLAPVAWPLTARVQGGLFADEVTVVSARVPGRVVEISCDLGDPVQLGNKIMLLDDSEYALRVSQAEALLSQARVAVGLNSNDAAESLDPMNAPPVREARAVLDEAKQKISRLKGLYEQGTVVATDVENAELLERVAEARFNSATNSVREKIAMIAVQSAQLALAKQQLADTQVLAPLEGRVQRRFVSVGTYVQAGEALVEIASTSVLRYRAAVPERLAQRVAVGQALKLIVEQEEFDVAVTRISPSLDPTSRSLMFEAEVPNADNRLRSGLFAQAELVLDDQSQAVAIPLSALVRFAGVNKVWKISDGKVGEAVIEIGRERNGEVEVVSGLAAGDTILSNGQLGRVGTYRSGHAEPVASDASLTNEAKGT